MTKVSFVQKPEICSANQKVNSFLKEVLYSEPCQTSKMELFLKIINGRKPLTIFAKSSILDVWLGSERAFGLVSSH